MRMTRMAKKMDIGGSASMRHHGFESRGGGRRRGKPLLHNTKHWMKELEGWMLPRKPETTCRPEGWWDYFELFNELPFTGWAQKMIILQKCTDVCAWMWKNVFCVWGLPQASFFFLKSAAFACEACRRRLLRVKFVVFACQACRSRLFGIKICFLHLRLAADTFLVKYVFSSNLPEHK